eukprot:NODE_11453_length_1285_cov_8.512953.p1 GENE.NODE_11453_length_1285_cov_8.512953~~NODE_11453_length_1285_cov_8.512953.p1  ORF type:complete len:275 (-),score=45.31 NODE_11453_length_1285_cov_8.512953:270-1094(-)
MGHKLSHCCHEESGTTITAETEVALHKVSGLSDFLNDHQCTSLPVVQHGMVSRDCNGTLPAGWCKTRGDGAEFALGGGVSADPVVESLNYMPLAYDASQTTIDLERSHDRYKKLAMHSKHGWSLGTAMPSAAWMRAAASGMPVTIVTPAPAPVGTLRSACGRLQGMLYLDGNFTKVTLLSVELSNQLALRVRIDQMQVISPTSDSEFYGAVLDPAELGLGVLIQYTLADDNCGATDVGPWQVCFLVAAAPSREAFIDGLTTLWLEKRNQRETWF